ncbi:MAG: asparagine synthase (glutamine-hydrolyzing) [Candidatus Taylorbacteria bacterium RIFOXYD2_FULL_36_9]|uniref:asparagine synthase (glutamine-hydrolyzing) n=1 Tax=Candidatus Taylorbacteria bacterium RIFOXYD2_FULL_36_9 TaxID=1802338 RepID=A0A1G2PEM9_9BACT|nr:MAG: asparagine synthase (glutamine-hydrolyzing) [Candidatus Taylorbacteria bacterium RIFOXYD2_FULL_36_9]
MCGIIAISGVNLDIKKYDTDSMLKAIRQRGPDSTGVMRFPHCFLGHQRLSIIDIGKGAQPMQSKNLSITFNGEIYNYRNLKSELSKEGFVFETNSDTEVILKAYQKWGYDCVKKLDGMFAFAIWDNDKEELFFARDRIGKKPLFYCFDEQKKEILISSEIKSLVASKVFIPKIDYSSIDNYLRVMYIPPWKTVYKNIHQLSPAHYALYKNGVMTITRYWQLVYKPAHIPYEDAKNEVHRLLINAVNKRLISSDTEVGSFLSGGVDSSLVTIIASKLLDRTLKTFAVSYSGHDELPFAKQVSEKINSELFSIEINQANMSELETVVEYFDEPHADTSDFPQHLISKLASEKLKVVLSGDGADEIFLGYKWHNKGTHEDLFDQRINAICVFDDESRKELWGTDKYSNNDIVLPEVFVGLDNDVKKVEIFDLTSHLPGQILTKVDRASMMHSLEVRCPFLDIELIEYVFNLPYEYKVTTSSQKHILREILSLYMPRDFSFRKKQGFGSPIWEWMNNENVKKYIYNKLGQTAVIRQFLNGDVIDKYVSHLYTESPKHERAYQRVWVLLCLELWAKNNQQYL